MNDKDDIEGKVAALQADIDQQKAVVEDRHRRKRPAEADETLLSEMMMARDHLAAQLAAKREGSRLRMLAEQCRNLSNGAPTESARAEFLRMAEEYDRRSDGASASIIT